MNPLERLAVFDPDLAAMVAARAASLSAEVLERLVSETLWASSLEPSFGQAVARGYLELAETAQPETASEYRQRVRQAGRRGPAFGRLMALHLPPILCSRSQRLIPAFFETVGVLLAKGAYTLPNPLEALSSLLGAGQEVAAETYLDLLRKAFSHDLSYVRSQHFAHLLPRAVLSFSPAERTWQTVQLGRVARADPHLVDPFLEGMAAGLHLLSESGLEAFVSQALNTFGANRKKAAQFLSLSAESGMAAFRNLQVTVSLGDIGGRLNRYLHARIGEGASVKPLEALSTAFHVASPVSAVVTDGRCIYLPGRMGAFPSRSQNISLYKALVRAEAGHLEFGTFDFDLEKMAADGLAPSVPQPGEEMSDLQRFLGAFAIPQLAGDLFTVYEHGRVRKCMARRYPGLIRRTLPLLKQEARRQAAAGGDGPLQALYRLAALGMGPGEPGGALAAAIGSAVGSLGRRFEERITADCAVEACGRLLCETYPEMERLCRANGGFRPLVTPFGRKLRPDLVFSRQQDHHRAAWKIKSWIEDRGYRVYASDIRRRLVDGNGKLSAEDLRRLVRVDTPKPDSRTGDTSVPGEPPDRALRELLSDRTVGVRIIDDGEPDETIDYPVFRYDEWDSGVSDYLQDHVRVCQRPVPEAPNDFYRLTLDRHRGLVKRMRHAFELLKPEGLKILRRWVEGDEFDYRALLNAALDRKAGLIPSDRLYNKRVKQQRDVAVLLLVDLSRSTANRVRGSAAAVLDVEKEAIVLFCEALSVVGDDFCIGGFSGTGRLGVDYYTVKRFEETMNDTVRARISGLSPQRSTRMGAAVRHASRSLQESPARVKLLIILGDGFPNDIDYKQGYAVADTRRAIAEAHAKGIFTHAVTVNIAGDPRLDELYGHVRHTVISEVRELPDRLLRIYGSLTRH